MAIISPEGSAPIGSSSRTESVRTTAASAFSEEQRIQETMARQRAEEREEERRTTEAKLGRRDGMVRANDPLRVAKRLDRVTRYMTGGDPMDSPANAPAGTLVRNSVKRVSEVLETPAADLAADVESELVGRAASPQGDDEESAAPVAEDLLERIINTADFLSVRYLDAGVLAEHAVGRVNIRDERKNLTGYGTGFLVSPTLLLTNHHVLPDARTARLSAIEFDYQDGIDGQPLRSTLLPFAPDRFFIANRELDFALVQVEADPEVLAGFGFCHLTAAQGTVLIGECVTIVQHPRGEKKQIALRENRLIDIPETVLHYAADTEPGSSGSPVFNDQWEVVALHHASVRTPQHEPEYKYLNEGIRISRILAFLADAPLSAEERELVGQLGTAKHAATVRARTEAGDGRPASTRSEVRMGAFSPPEAGTITVDVPLRITVQLGTPTLPMATATAITTGEGGAAEEAVAIDPDYTNRSGYDPEFLGVSLPLPGVDKLAHASKELKYHHFSVVMHRQRRLALFTAVNIDGRQSVRIDRESDRWIFDPRLPREEQTGEEVYRKNSLDRGHLVRRLDPAWGSVAKAANDDTFHFTNSTPQHHDFNAGRTLWVGLEDYILKNADNHDLAVSVITGPILDDADPLYRGVPLPRQFFKVVAMVTSARKLSATAYLLSQEALLDEFATGPEEFSFGAYRTFQVPVRRVEDMTGLDLTPYVAGDPLDRLESASLPRQILREEDLLLVL